LAHRQRRKDMIDEMRCGLCHAPRIARRTDTASLKRKCDEKVSIALRAVSTSGAIGEGVAFQIVSEVPLDIGWDRLAVPVAFARQQQVGLQGLLDDAVEDGLLRMATGVRSPLTSL
jgi:hypothetical protein